MATLKLDAATDTLLVGGVIPSKDLLGLRKGWNGTAHVLAAPENEADVSAIKKVLGGLKISLTDEVKDWMQSKLKHWSLTWDSSTTKAAPQGFVVCEYPTRSYDDPYEVSARYWAIDDAAREMVNRERIAASTPGHHAWRWPLHGANAKRTLDLFEAQKLALAGDLQGLLVEAAIEWESREKGSWALTDDGKLVIPGPLGTAARPYQRVGIATMLARKKLLLADDVGLGKTAQSLGVLACLGQAGLPALLVVGANVRKQWLGEIFKWLPNAADLKILTITDKDDDFNSVMASMADIVIISHSLLGVHNKTVNVLKGRGLKALFIDESAHVKEKGTRVTQAAMWASRDVPYVYLLSATPMPNRISELAAQIDILDAGDGDVWGALGGRPWFNQEFGRGVDEISPYQVGVLNTLLRRSGHFIRREKKQVAAELPEIQVEVRSVNITNDAEYKQAEQVYLENALINSSSDYDFRRAIASLPPAQQNRLNQLRIQAQARRSWNPLAEMSLLRHMVAVGKANAVIETVAEMQGDEGVATAVFGHHRDALAALGEGLNAPVIAGGDNSNYVEKVKAEYRSGGLDTVIISQKAGGEGVNLQRDVDTKLQRVVMSELDWSPATTRQAIGRVHRLGMKAETVHVVSLVATGTIDDHVQKILAAKGPLVDQIMDDNALSPVKDSDMASAITQSLIEEKAATFKWTKRLLQFQA